MNLKQVLTWAGAAFLIWGCIQQPAAAAYAWHGIWNFLHSAAFGLQHFITHV